MASCTLLSRQWRVPMAPSRCRDIQGCSCQQFVLWLQQRATMETLGGKGKTGGCGEQEGRGTEKANSHFHSMREQGEQVTNGPVTKCHVVSHRERIDFPAGNIARSLISWQLRNMSLESRLQAV